MPSFFKKTSRSFPFRSVNEELRVAVKQGQIATVSELIAKGAKFVPDKVQYTNVNYPYPFWLRYYCTNAFACLFLIN